MYKKTKSWNAKANYRQGKETYLHRKIIGCTRIIFIYSGFNRNNNNAVVAVVVVVMILIIIVMIWATQHKTYNLAYNFQWK